jgi:hypothetical protein
MGAERRGLRSKECGIEGGDKKLNHQHTTFSQQNKCAMITAHHLHLNNQPVFTVEAAFCAIKKQCKKCKKCKNLTGIRDQGTLTRAGREQRSRRCARDDEFTEEKICLRQVPTTSLGQGCLRLIVNKKRLTLMDQPFLMLL